MMMCIRIDLAIHTTTHNFRLAITIVISIVTVIECRRRVQRAWVCSLINVTTIAKIFVEYWLLLTRRARVSALRSRPFVAIDVRRISVSIRTRVIRLDAKVHARPVVDGAIRIIVIIVVDQALDRHANRSIMIVTVFGAWHAVAVKIDARAIETAT